ncbi:hypothetical protein ROSA5918_23925 [Roseateles saccharophilus]|uniref:Uncharacterized protein n=1 Tax=Roseateles saccharophilus TaxID=304 RepID=A0A4R3UBR3_ROSSA|nr:hypothetical protein EV671_10556 [Roseateles saccharophilus]
MAGGGAAERAALDRSHLPGRRQPQGGARICRRLAAARLRPQRGSAAGQWRLLAQGTGHGSRRRGRCPARPMGRARHPQPLQAGPAVRAGVPVLCRGRPLRRAGRVRSFQGLSAQQRGDDGQSGQLAGHGAGHCLSSCGRAGGRAVEAPGQAWPLVRWRTPQVPDRDGRGAVGGEVLGRGGLRHRAGRARHDAPRGGVRYPGGDDTRPAAASRARRRSPALRPRRRSALACDLGQHRAARGRLADGLPRAGPVPAQGRAP